jgi:hypothetical protein
MTIDKLIKYCLQYLELDTETNVMNTSVYELAENDTFVEYMNNIENSLLMGLTRYASSNLLPVKIFAFDEGVYSADLVDTRNIPKRESNGDLKYKTSGEIDYKKVTKPLANKIKEVFAINSNGDIISNIEYYVIGNNVRIKKPRKDYQYNVIYYPAIHDFDFYLSVEDTNIYDIELSDLGVTDEMAINLKYFVYSDLKLEENPNLANINKNYFETYLASLERIQVSFNQTELVNRANVDVYGDEVIVNNREWSDIYGD